MARTKLRARGPGQNMAAFCGCYIVPPTPTTNLFRQYLPRIHSKAHISIESTFYRTVLTQVYSSGTDAISNVSYCFPLYDGVSVVDFQCQIGERLIKGVVKERDEAKKTYEDAVNRGESAGLLEQSLNAADVFQTSLGNIPANTEVVVTVTYVGELKHDAEVDGIRFTIPTSIFPRYGKATLTEVISSTSAGQGSMEIVADVSMSQGSPIKNIQSPSHPISVSIGTVSTAANDDPVMTKGSATLSLGNTALDEDFVLQIVTKAVGKPYALLENHPVIENHRAIMATLVPNFSLKPERPEIIFVADRSGSMQNNIPTLISALQVFLKSLPMGVKFNLWSFGSSASSLWPKSKVYSKESVEEASHHVNTFAANFGGTETLNAMTEAINSRETKMPTEVILLTDGDIWSQDALFRYLNEQVAQSETRLRVFPIGIGNGVSTALLEGVARAGNGFSQAVQNGERLEGKIVRVLKGALSPHLTDCALEIKYAAENNDDYEIIEKVVDEVEVKLNLNENESVEKEKQTNKAPISLYDDDRMEDVQTSKDSLKTQTNKYEHLPAIDRPKLLQAPHKMPALFSFNRTCVYILLSPEADKRIPESVIFRAKCPQGPLELEMKIQSLEKEGETIHQLAAKKAIQELEEGRGWLHDAKDKSGQSVKETHSARFEEIVEREAVRLGVEFQVGGKWCSFVAVESNDMEIAERKKKAIRNRTLKSSGIFRQTGSDSVESDGFDDDFEAIESYNSPIQQQTNARGAEVRRAPRKQLASNAARASYGNSLDAPSAFPLPPPSPQQQQQQQQQQPNLFGAAPVGRDRQISQQNPLFAASLGGASFGSGPAHAQQQPNSLFSTAQPQGSQQKPGGLFGTANNQQSLSTGGGLFGQNVRSSGGGLFGQNVQSSGGGFFGHNVQSSGRELFGENAQSSSFSGEGGFGQNVQSSSFSGGGKPLFGSSQNQQSVPAPGNGHSLFGSTYNGPRGPSMFGTPPSAIQADMSPMPSSYDPGASEHYDPTVEAIPLSAPAQQDRSNYGPPMARNARYAMQDTSDHSPSDPMSRLVGAQSFDGSWRREVLAILGLDLKKAEPLTKTLIDAGLKLDLAEMVMATAIAVEYLEKHGGEGGGYELMLDKARMWMEDSANENGIGMDIVERVLDEARNLV